MGLELIYHGALAVVLAILTILFIIQKLRKKKSVSTLLISLIFGLCASIISVINDLLLVDIGIHTILLSTQVGLFALQFYFWYIHLERIASLRIHYIRFGVTFGFLILTLISVTMISLMQDFPETQIILWLFADIGYDTLALIVFGGFGTKVSTDSYQHTKDKRQILFFLAYLMISIGFFIILIQDLNEFFGNGHILGIIDLLGDVGHVLPLLGLMVLIVVYITDINYIYRLPFDVHLLLIANKTSGNLISAVWFKSKHQINLEIHLVTGILVALNGLFGEIFASTKRNIQEISGINAKLLMEVGNEIVGIILSERSSYYLSHSLNLYVKAFEKRFHGDFEHKENKLKKIQAVEDLISNIFPFCKPDLSKNI